MGGIKAIAGEADIIPLNGYARIQDIKVEGETMSGKVSDYRKDQQLATGDFVYFQRKHSFIMVINGKEDVFVNVENVVFKVGG